jgi:hypothetical protein
MALPSNPATLANFDITKGDQAKVFVKKVSDLFQALSTATQLAGILNGSGVVSGSALVAGSVPETALTSVQTNLGSVSTNQTVNCANASSVFVNFNYTAAITLNLTNLAAAAWVFIRATNTTGGALVLKMAGTGAAGSALTGGVFAVFVVQGVETNMGTTGQSLNAGVTEYYSGTVFGAASLYFISL